MGDEVLAYDQRSGKEGYYRVRAVLVHSDRVIEHLTVAGEQVDTTPEQLFHTRERGWVEAGELKAGMHVREANGSWAVVERVTFERHAERMFNLTVGSAHTFFVGQHELLVHNNCGRRGAQSRLRQLANDHEVSRSLRGWIRNEIRHIRYGNRSTIRRPPGYELAHRRGYPARRGHSYLHSDLQNADLHKLQHKIWGYFR